ncbi:MAG: type II secretion system GspH family protein [Lachnospiraceae bacterium]|nr:type II secretion system GspH family protein [Lachnospiraceae bacterium]
MERSSDNKSIINDNSGLSIVEVLVAVAILAIVFVPLLKTFTQASTINARAQKLQNVTSLAEGVMEDVKGKSIQELHDLAVERADVSFLPLDKDGTLTKGNLNNVPPYTVTYENVTATQGITYDAVVTIATENYKNKDKDVDDIGDVSDANIRELPQINKVDSNKNAVLSWELNKYDNKALENLAAENSVTGSDIATLKDSYKNTAEKYINIEIKEDTDTSSTKVSCEVEYKTGKNASDKSLKYLVYTGYFVEPLASEPAGPNIYLFYTLTEKVKDGASNIADPIKKENIKIEDKTTGKRHNVYFIVQDGINKLSTYNGSKVTINVSGSGYSETISYDKNSIIPSAITLLAGASTPDDKSDDVYFFTNLEDKKLFTSKSKDRIYYVTVEIKEHGKPEVLGTYTSTMQTGAEAE